MDGYMSESAKKFFNNECIKNLSSIQTKCDKKVREQIVKKYTSKQNAKGSSSNDVPFEVGKAILREVNANNEP